MLTEEQSKTTTKNTSGQIIPASYNKLIIMKIKKQQTTQTKTNNKELEMILTDSLVNSARDPNTSSRGSLSSVTMENSLSTVSPVASFKNAK